MALRIPGLGREEEDLRFLQPLEFGRSNTWSRRWSQPSIAASAGPVKMKLKFGPQPNANALTNTILGYLEANRLQEAVKVLFQSPDSIPYSLYSRIFGLCSDAPAIVEARKVESHLVSSDPIPLTFLLNRAIETYGVCMCLEDAPINYY